MLPRCWGQLQVSAAKPDIVMRQTSSRTRQPDLGSCIKGKMREYQVSWYDSENWLALAGIRNFSFDGLFWLRAVLQDPVTWCHMSHADHFPGWQRVSEPCCEGASPDGMLHCGRDEGRKRIYVACQERKFGCPGFLCIRQDGGIVLKPCCLDWVVCPGLHRLGVCFLLAIRLRLDAHVGRSHCRTLCFRFDLCMRNMKRASGMYLLCTLRRTCQLAMQLGTAAGLIDKEASCRTALHGRVQ